MGPIAVLLDPDSARNPGRRDRAARDRDDLVRAPRQLPPPSRNRAMDLAAVDVRLGDGRDCLSDALPDVHPNLSVASNRHRAIHPALKKKPADESKKTGSPSLEGRGC